MIVSKLVVKQAEVTRQLVCHRWHRFPPDIISYVVWPYYRFNLRRVGTVIAGVPDHCIEDLLAERGVVVSREPRKIVADKLRSYGVAHRELIPEVIHSTNQYEHNRAEQS